MRFERESFNRTIRNDAGDIVPNAQITVYSSSGGLATIYGSLTGAPKDNPFNTDAGGKAEFYAEPGRYNVHVFKGGNVAVLNNVDLSQKALRQDIGFAGSFESGFNITNAGQFVIFKGAEANQPYIFRWNGALPKSVEANSTPENTGGISPEGWVVVGGSSIIDELSSPSGSDLVGYGSITLTQALDDTSEALDLISQDVSEIQESVSENHIEFSEFKTETSEALTETQPYSFQIADGITSWWAAPSFLNNGRYSYIAHSQGGGQIALTKLDNQKNTANTYIMDSENFNADDHNTGSVAAGDGRVFAVWPGRERKDGTGSNFSFYYAEFGEDTDPSNIELTEIDQSRDYPVVYNIGDEFIMFGRNSNQASEPQYTLRRQSWPFNGFGFKIDFMQTSETWPYLATRRSASDKNKINLAIGFHPTNNPFSNVYVGTIERSGGVGDWTINSQGVQVANITTGANLPFNQNDLELAYEAGTNERVRLLNISDNAILIVSYQESSPNEAVYKLVSKSGGVWTEMNLGPTGKPFEESAGVQYFGGGSISSDESHVEITVEDGGIWSYKKLAITSPTTYELVEEFRSRGPDGMSVVLGRPHIEDYSDTSWLPSSERQERTMVFAGRYNPISYNDFNTSLVSTDYLKNDWQPSATKSNGAAIASEGCLTREHRTAAIASRSSFLTGRISAVMATQTTTISGNRSAAVATTGSDITGSTAATVASNNCTVSGDIAGAYSCTLSTASGENSGVYSSTDTTASGFRASAISCAWSASAHGRSVLIGARAVRSSGEDRIAGGYSTSTTPSTANRTWELNSRTGQLQIAGSLVQHSGFADIAKMFKNGEGSEIGPGYLVTLVGDSVYKTQPGDKVTGAIASTPASIHNDTPFTWQGRYLRDEWGRIIKEDGEPVENPDYDEDAVQLPRSERPDEWSCVGVHGLLRVRIDGSLSQSDVAAAAMERRNLYLEAGDNGIGVVSSSPTQMQVLEVEKEFDGNYGIARVMHSG